MAFLDSQIDPFKVHQRQKSDVYAADPSWVCIRHNSQSFVQFQLGYLGVCGIDVARMRGFGSLPAEPPAGKK